MSVHITPAAILVKRDGALGDVFDTTPVVARLYQENPGITLHIQTAYPQVYDRNPHATPRPSGWPDESYARIIDLNMAFEKRLRRMSAIDAYMLEAFGDMGDGHSKQLVYGYDRSPPRCINIDWSRAVSFHPARSWPQRTLPLLFWEAFAREILQRGFSPVVIGTEQDWAVNVQGVDQYPRLTLDQQIAAIAASRVYIGSASGPCHYAACTDTPIVSLLTMSPAWAVMHERHGRMGWAFRGIEAPIACQGCSARWPEPCTYHDCERGDNICTTLFDPVAVADAACEMAEMYPK
jgi:ADP-heptose:LPS heptosyltransferase